MAFTRDGERENVVVKGWATATGTHRDVLYELAVRGEGVLQVLDWACRDELREGLLVPALDDWIVGEAPPAMLLYHPSTRRMPRARAFIRFATDVFAEVATARGLEVRIPEPPVWNLRRYARSSLANDRLSRFARRP